MRMGPPTRLSAVNTIAAATYNSAGFQISIPLRIFDRNQGEKERTRYEAEASRFAETAAAQSGDQRRGSGMGGYEAAIDMAKHYNSHYVAESQRVRDNLEFSYRHGGTTLLDYLDALRDYRQIATRCFERQSTGLAQHSSTQLRCRYGDFAMKWRIFAVAAASPVFLDCM